MFRLQPLIRNQQRLSAAVLADCLFASGYGLAETTEPAIYALKLSGFGKVGVTHASAHSNWGYQRDSFQPANDGGTPLDTDSRLGLQANYTVDPKFELVGQLLLTRRVAFAPRSDAITWAFAAYRPNNNLSLRI